MLAGGVFLSAIPTAFAEAPSGILLDTPVVTENWPAGTVVGTLSAVDADPGDSHLFSFVQGDSSLDNSGFYIVGNQLRVLYGVTLDLDTEPRDLQIRLRVIDSTSQTFEQAIAITVVDDRTEDFDSDGISEADEEDLHGTSDNDVDSDNDGVGDGGELAAVPPTSPSNPTEWPATAVVGWGSSHWGEQSSPPGGGVLAMATGEVHSLALKSNGMIDAWGGGNSYGQNNIPAGLSQVVDIAAGGNFWLEDSSHSLALKSDGSVVGWGYDHGGDNVVPAGLGQVTAIAAGRSHGVALKTDGTVVTWGYNPHGGIEVPSGLSDVVDVSARGFYSLALKVDGTVVTWGSNFDGAKWVDATSPVGLRDVVAISAGRFHSLALKHDGTVVAWGNNTLGQTNVPPGLANVVSISAGGFHSMALKQDGTVVTWGSNTHGQCNIAPAAFSGVKLISAGILHSLAVIQSEGYPSITSAPNILSTPGVAISHQVTVANAQPITYSAVGLPAGLQIDAQTGLISGVTGATRSSVKIKVETDQGTLSQSAWIGVYEGLPATAISLTPSDVLENSTNGTIIGTLVSTDPDEGDSHTYEWVDGPGSTDNHRFRIEGDQIVLDEDITRNFETSPGGFTIRLRSRDSSLNAYEQTIAIGFLDDRNEDTDGDGLTEAQEEDLHFTSDINPDSDGDGFSDGFEVSRGFLPNNNASLPTGRITLGWGSADEGQTMVPSDLDTVVKISAGSAHSLALKADGVVLAWGGNDDGQCSLPSELGAASAIAAGGKHSLALMLDGTVQAWGNNDFLQSTVPAGLTGVVDISAGARHSLALKTDGTVVAWGDDSDGQCLVPLGLSDVIAIAAGGSHSLALKSDGTVIGWGAVASGAATIPMGLNGVIAIAAGGMHSLALKLDGSVLAWGSNADGQCMVPVSAVNGVAIAAGRAHSMILKADQSIVAWGGNGSGQSTVPMEAIKVRAMDAGDDFNLVIRQNSGFPSFQDLTKIPGWPAEPLSRQISVVNGSATGFSAMGLPDGLGIDSLNGLVSGTPNAAVQRAVRVSAVTDQGTLTGVVWIDTAAGTAPVDIELDGSELVENSPDGTVVGTLTAVDPNVGDSHGFEMVGTATDSFRFRIEGSQLVVAGKLTANFDAGVPFLSVRIRANDVAGNSFERNFILSLTDDRNEDADGDGISEANEEDVLGSSDAVFDNFSRSDSDKDGMAGLEEYAFNLDPKVAGPLVRIIPGAGSTAGLPSITMEPDGLGGFRLRIEYIRRIGSGMTYTPQFGNSPAASGLVNATGSVTVTPIDTEWERCVVFDSQSTGTAQRRFGSVKITW